MGIKFRKSRDKWCEEESDSEESEEDLWMRMSSKEDKSSVPHSTRHHEEKPR